MLGAWARSPRFKVGVLALIVLVLASSFWGKKDPLQADAQFDLRIKEALGYVAAEEAATVLGPSGGKVALILPPMGSGEAVEEGFRVALKKLPALRLEGVYKTESTSFQFQDVQPYLEARGKFPAADLLVSFVDMPRLDTSAEAEWVRSSPLRMLTVERQKPEAEVWEKMVRLGVVQTVIAWKDGVRYPEPKPTNRQEIFNLFYEVIRAK